jgi:hypothetical protein
MNPYRFKVSLRIRHPSLNPVEITSALGINPSRSWIAAEPRFTPSGSPLDVINRESYWTAELIAGNSEENGLSSAIAAVLDRLSPHAPFLARLNAEGGGAEFFVGWFCDATNFGEVFGPHLLGRLAALGIGLSLDVYGGPPS